jgi:hypothetical protein
MARQRQLASSSERVTAHCRQSRLGEALDHQKHFLALTAHRDAGERVYTDQIYDAHACHERLLTRTSEDDTPNLVILPQAFQHEAELPNHLAVECV